MTVEESPARLRRAGDWLIVLAADLAAR